MPPYCASRKIARLQALSRRLLPIGLTPAWQLQKAGRGQIATEDNDVPANFPFPRVSEQTALSLKGVRASVMRLPQVHDTVKQGLVTLAVAVAREKGVSAYV